LKNEHDIDILQSCPPRKEKNNRPNIKRLTEQNRMPNLILKNSFVQDRRELTKEQLPIHASLL